jgi:hypothetical protein
MKEINTYQVGHELFQDVAKLIDDTRKSVAYTVNLFIKPYKDE